MSKVSQSKKLSPGITTQEEFTKDGIKYIRKQIIFDPKEKSKVEREIKALSILKMSNFIPVVSYEVDEPRHLFTVIYQTSNFTLRQFIDKYTKDKILSELGIMIILIKILEGIYTLHQHNYFHRNLTMDSILIEDHGEIIIGGLDRLRDYTTEKNDYSEIIVSHPYFAPEISEKKYSPKVDIYSIGGLLYDLLSPTPLTTNIVRQFHNKRGKLFTSQQLYDPYLYKLTEKMLSKDPNNRPSAIDTLLDPFVMHYILLCRDRPIYVNGSASPDILVSGKSLGERTPFSDSDFSKDPSDMKVIKEYYNHGAFGYIDIIQKFGLDIVRKTVPKSRVRNQVNPEIENVTKMFHNNIITTLSHLSNEDDKNYYIFLEFCRGGSLLDRINDINNMDNDTYLNVDGAYKLICSLLNALYHIHHQDFVHRDIKPDNIFLTYNGTIVLGDLGLLKDLKSDDNIEGGDLYYMSPETFLNMQNISSCQSTCDGSAVASISSQSSPEFELKEKFKSDIYSLGCTLHHIFSGKKPPRINEYVYNEDDKDDKDLLKWELPTPYKDYEELQNILNLMLRMKVEDRINIDELVKLDVIAKYNYKTRSIPFLVDGVINEAYLNKSVIPEAIHPLSLSETGFPSLPSFQSFQSDQSLPSSPSLSSPSPLPTTPKTIYSELSLFTDYNILKLWDGTEKIFYIDKFLDEIDFPNLCKTFPIIFPRPEIFDPYFNTFSSKFNINTEFILNLKTVAETCIKLLNIRVGRNGYITYEGTNHSWMNHPNILHGFTNMFSIFNKLYYQGNLVIIPIHQFLVGLYRCLLKLGITHNLDFILYHHYLTKWREILISTNKVKLSEDYITFEVMKTKIGK